MTTHATVRLADYTPPPFLIDTVQLSVDLHPTETKIVSKLRLRPNPKALLANQPLVLDGEAITLVSIALDGKPLDARDYRVTSQAMAIARVPDRPFTLDIVTTCNPTANTQLSGLYLSRGIYTTQCEAEGFRRITYFLDRPDVLATYTVRLEADATAASVMLANGNPIERGTLKGGKRHYAVWKDPHPKPSYLFALVGGNLTSFASTFETKSGREIDLRIYVEPGKESRCAWAMDALKRSMTWDEERFGLEYDLDVFNIVAVSDFNMGAMENKGLNIFNDRLVLASPDTATDRNYLDIERVVAHEYFHNWTGNRITCRDWFQLCLKEGLTVYRDQEFTSDMRSRAIKRIDDVVTLRNRQFPEDAGPLAHAVRPEQYIEINNFYSATVYDKGAEIVRMLATLLGPQDFRAGMDLYIQRHDGEAATVEQFVACFAEVSKRDLSQFMLWYSQAGTPDVACSFKHDPKTQTAELELIQRLRPTPGQPLKQPMHIPVRIGLLDAKGRDLPLARHCNDIADDGVLELIEPRHVFRFSGLKERPVPSILRAFSAPVRLAIDLTDADLAHLMGRDSDSYNRWQAGQDYAGRLLLGAMAALKAGKRPAKPKAFTTALAASLADKKLDMAYRAQLLTLPSAAEVWGLVRTEIDPALVHQASTWLEKQIAADLGDDLEALYELLAPKGRFSPDAAQAGRRALRNRALALLFARGTSADTARAVAHFESAATATDEIDALGLLATAKGAARKAALARFHDRWKDDHIVIDQWFKAQVVLPEDSVLDAIDTLTRDPLFSLANPNKVRALLINFAILNPVQFNRPDGAGYDFIAARVKELDAINPQTAARLVGAFRSWASLEPGRRKLARSALSKVMRARGLSRDVAEIVGKMLG